MNWQGPCWPATPGPIDPCSPLFAYPGTRAANDPRSGIFDSVTIYSGTGLFGDDRRGRYVVQRRMIGVYPGLTFFDPLRAGFSTIENARAWVFQEFPYVSECFHRAPSDHPTILETWL